MQKKSFMIAARRLSFFIAILLTGIAGLFFQEQLRAEPAAASGMTKIKLQINGVDQVQYAGYYIALEKGFYRDAGLDVEIVLSPYPDAKYEDVLDNRVQFGIAGPELIYARAQGKPLVALAAILQKSPREFVTLKQSGINSVANFKGKRIVIPPLPNAPELWDLLLRNGLNPESFTAVTNEFSVTQLYEGAADVMAATQGTQSFLLQHADLPFVTFAPAPESRGFYNGILYTSETNLRRNPALVKKFTQAGIKGWQYAMDNPAETSEMFQKKYGKSQPAFIASQLRAIRQLTGPANQLGKMTISNCHLIADFYVKNGLLPKNYNLAGFIIPQDENYQADHLYYHWDAPSLTAQERDWLQHTAVIKALSNDNPPFSEWNNGHPTGILSEYLLATAWKYNLPLEFEYKNRLSDLQLCLKQGEFDLITAVDGAPGWDDKYMQTNAMIKAPCAVYLPKSGARIKSLEEISGKTVGVVAMPELMQILQQRHRTISYKAYLTPENACNDLKDGKIAAIAAMTYSMTWHLKNHKDFDIDPAFYLEGFYGTVFIAVKRDQPLLAAIINKAIASMPPKIHGAIYNSWIEKMTGTGIDPIRRQTPLIPPWILWCGGLIVLLLLSAAGYQTISTRRLRRSLRTNINIRKRLEMIMDSMDDAVLIIDIDREKIVDCNAAALRLYEYPREEFIQLDVSAITAEPEQTKKAIRHPSAEITRRRHRRKDGKEIVVSIHNSLVHFEGHNLEISVVRDISNVVNVETAARKQEENFKVTLNSIGDAVVTTDTNGKIVIMNPVAESLTGISMREGYGHLVDEVIKLFDPLTHEKITCPTSAVLKSGKVISISDNISLLSLSGKSYRIILSTSPITDYGHNRLGTVMVIRDITAEYHRGQELKLWADRLNIAADAAEFGIWECTATPNQTSPEIIINEIWRRLYELPLNNTNILETWENGIDVLDREETVTAFNAAMSGKTDLFIREFRFHTPSGHTKWIYTLCKVVDSPQRNTPRRLIGIHQDITERKNNEAQLILARQAAEAANQAKSQFIATMSHEIRTPMNGIIGFIELLQETEVDDNQHHYISVALKSCYTLLNLLNDILDFSRIEAGHMVLRPETFNLRHLLHDLDDTIRTLIPRDKIELVFTIPDDMPQEVTGDQTRIRQVLTNLLANAIKFTDAGRVELEISCIPQDSSNTIFKFCVKDSGIGISPEEQAKIFDKFHQIDGSSIRKYGGTGLGLSICRELALLMDGDIYVSSTPGQGSMFTFKVPLPILHSFANSDFLPPLRHNYNILIVEDNRVNQMVIKHQLKKHGFDCAVAENGTEAVSMTENGKYDLILLDCLMPEMDGYETAARIRNSETPNRDIPIIALTADAVDSSRQKCLDAGMNDYLVKPVKTNELLNVLNHHLHLSDSDAAAVEPS